MSGTSLIEQHGECYDCPETLTIGSYDRLTLPLATGIYMLQAELTNSETGERAKASNRLLFTD
jgi:hypothetical protein